jgi:3-oxoacyl-[acyl-carrier protein] reductase
MSVLEERSGLAGKVAIVVGGAGGIGRSVSIDLARSGVGVALCDIDTEAVAEIEPLLQEIGVDHMNVYSVAAITTPVGS